MPSYRVDVNRMIRAKWLEQGLAHSKCSASVMLHNSLHKIKGKTSVDIY